MALGSDPHQPDRAEEIWIQSLGGSLLMSARLSTQVEGISYGLASSSDLETWQKLGPSDQEKWFENQSDGSVIFRTRFQETHLEDPSLISEQN